MYTIVNNNVYLKFAKRVDLKCSHHTHKKLLTIEDNGFTLVVLTTSQMYTYIKTSCCNSMSGS